MSYRRGYAQAKTARGRGATGIFTTLSMTTPGRPISEILDDQQKQIAAGFMDRVLAFFTSIGVSVARQRDGEIGRAHV